MHGAQSGHLLVYCNTKIILIDFKVLTDASYSFFIEDELCEISIERKENQFYYGFEINKKVDTPLNRMRKKREKKDLIQSLMLLGGIAVLITAFVFGLNTWNRLKHKAAFADKLAEMGRETSATLLVAPEIQGNLVSYYFLVNGKAYTVEEKTNAEQPIAHKTGLPLQKGDEFIVRYIPNNPRLHNIDYDRPTPKQLNIYRDRAIFKYIDEHPGADTSFCACLANIAFELKGVEGYADFYFQNTPPKKNPKHNSQSFLRLTRDVPFVNRVEERCKLLQ